MSLLLTVGYGMSPELRKVIYKLTIVESSHVNGDR